MLYPLESHQGFNTWLVPLLVILDHNLFLASNVINYGAKWGLYFYFYHWQVEYQPLSWFITFPVIMWHLDSGLLCNLITSLLILPIRGLVESDFQIGIGGAAYATLNTYWLISYTRAALFGTTVSLKVCDTGVVTASEMHVLLTKIHDILDSAVSKWVGNMAYILWPSVVQSLKLSNFEPSYYLDGLPSETHWWLLKMWLTPAIFCYGLHHMSIQEVPRVLPNS